MFFFNIRRAFIFAVCCLVFALSASAQRTPPAAYTSTTPVNYVRTWDAKAPQTNANTILVTASTDSFLMTTVYVDGLGRPIQTVAKGITPLGKDLVTPVTYDEFGREGVKYLPFAANNTDGNTSVSDGLFKLNPFGQQAAFYNTANTLSPIKGQVEAHFYGETFFEASPFSRPLESFAPGDSWVGTAGQSNASNRRSVKSEYLINTVADSVRIWNVTSTVSAVPTSSAIYPAGELYKNVTKDENSNAVIEYKDKEGKVILKKVQLANNTGTAHVGWLCTYYVYDDLGQLRYVLQPRAVELINANWAITNTIRDELCFYYGYDARGRMNVKKVPGAGEVHMVYDTRDRLVMSQDANLRTGTAKWMVTLYDELNRPKITGLLTNSAIGSKTTATHQSDASTSSAYPFAYNNLPSSGFELLTETGYDSYNNLPTGCPSASLDNSYTSSDFFTTYNAAPNYAQQVATSSQTKGLTTWTKVKILGTANDYLYTITLYDEKGRVIQVKSTNISGGTDIATTQYDFSGKVLRSHIKHQKSGSNANTYTVLTKSDYDHAGRLLTVKKRVNNNSTSITTDKTILTNTYDELGQLKTKKLSPDHNSSTGLETLAFDYNIRGWLLGANRDYAKSTSSTQSYFGFDLGYDKTAIASLGTYVQGAYNGNITGTVWKSKGDGEVRKYDFTYDAVNRLTAGDFNQFTSGGFNKTAGIDFSVHGLTYDGNGNLLSMNQKGWTLEGSKTIDSLLYTYNSGSNKLLNVYDRRNDAASKLGDFKTSTLHPAGSLAKSSNTVDYSYDDNGNLVKDLNKDLVTYDGANGIEYNHLNLPSKIKVKASSTANKGTIDYVYDAAGNKIKKVTTEGSKVTTTLYMFGTYINDTLQYLPQEEGRIRGKSDTAFVYDYMLKDHLGNVRMVLTEEEKADMYPAATMETADWENESLYYSKIQLTRVEKPAGYPTDSYTNPNDYVSRVIAEEKKIGPGIALKVMAGDKINLRVSSWYSLGGQTPDGIPNALVEDLLLSMAEGITGVSSGKAMAGELDESSETLGNSGLLDFLDEQSGQANGAKPNAFVNWILFDEQFKFVAGYSGGDQVGDDEEFKVHQFNNLPMGKSGYLYVYVSNESTNIPVYFDNMQVTHVRGPMLEETHYYPFGLTLAGISSKAAGGTENRLKYNGIEKEDDLEISVYDAHFRELDVQTGRWWQIDPVTDGYENVSPYASMYNDPIRYSDLLGNEGSGCCGGFIDGFIEGSKNLLISAIGAFDQGLHLGSFGLVSSDPFNFRNKLSEDQQGWFDGGQRAMSIFTVVTAFKPGAGAQEPSLQTVNGPTLPVKALEPVAMPLTVESSRGGGVESNNKGKQGELDGGADPRAGRKSYDGPVTGKTRISDIDKSKVLGEIKNNQNTVQWLSGQIKDGIAHAFETGRQYVLKLAKPDKITKPLKKEAEAGRVKIMKLTDKH